MLAQSAHPEQLSLGGRNKREGQTIWVHVRAKFGRASLKCFVAQNVAIVIERLLRERRNEFGMLR